MGVDRVHEVQRPAAACGLRGGPLRRITSGLRSIDADDDGAGVRLTDGPFHEFLLAERCRQS
jgi:hypothetical protein